MFAVRAPSLSSFRHVVDAIKDIVTDVNIDVDPGEGLSLQAMDGAHVCLVSLQMLPQSFDEFYCGAPRSLGVHVAHLAKILRCSPGPAGDVPLLLEVAADQPDHMQIAFGDAEFEMRLMAIDDSERLHIPELNSENCIVLKMTAGEYARTFKDLASLGEVVEVALQQEDAVSFKVEGDGVTARIALPCSVGRAVQRDGWSCKFGLRYLASFAKPGLAPEVELRLTDGMPLHVMYKISDGAVMSFFLAPKIEESDA